MSRRVIRARGELSLVDMRGVRCRLRRIARFLYRVLVSEGGLRASFLSPPRIGAIETGARSVWSGLPEFFRSMRKPATTPTPPPAQVAATDPLSADAIGAALHASESIKALRVVGTEHSLPLPAKNVLRIGTGAVDVRVPVLGDQRPVSREHAELTRQGSDEGTWLQVVDLQSTNGTFFRGARERDFAVSAGQRFSLATTELLVMDESPVRLRLVLEQFFGFTAHQTVDNLLTLLLEHDAILLLGDRGSERGHLAHAIRQCSRRRGHPFRELKRATGDRASLLPEFRDAASGTVFASLDNLGGKAGLATLTDLMFDPTYAVRPIIAARDLTQVCSALSVAATRFRAIAVPPVRTRARDIPALLDLMLEEWKSPHRVAQLRPDRLEAMCEFEWLRNRAELRETAERLAALIAHGGNHSAAAKSINQDVESFRRALARAR